jgi:predicted rRNA methylase YqxC with S4 and FtsJ domains
VAKCSSKLDSCLTVFRTQFDQQKALMFIHGVISEAAAATRLIATLMTQYSVDALASLHFKAQYADEGDGIH